MTKHTPGPWHEFAPDILEHGIDQTYRSIVGGDGVFYHGTGFVMTGFVKSEDARLMAAAPELLDELKNLHMAFMQGWRPDNQCLERIAALIAKVEGRS